VPGESRLKTILQVSDWKLSFGEYPRFLEAMDKTVPGPEFGIILANRAIQATLMQLLAIL